MQPVQYNFFPQQQYTGGVYQSQVPVQTGLSTGLPASQFGASLSADRPGVSLAGSFDVQPNNNMMQLLQQMMQLMQQMIQMFMGGSAPTPPQPQPVPLPGPVPQPQPLPYPGPIGGYPPQPAPLPQPLPTPTPQPSALNGGLNNNDLLNYVLAGSKGGTVNPDGAIFGQYADQNSRFAQAGANEFDAVVAKTYTAQFKGYALGLDSVFTPGQDTPQKIANNLETALNTQMTPEAELISKVAAVYRGDLGGRGAYNNAALGQLLTKWGRQDIAAQPGVGQTDIESIGGVVKALNEEQNAAIRQAWLQDIFDFKNNTPNSPSGAVPDTKKYQDAINVVQSGTLDKLLDNYGKGIKTNGPVTGSTPTGPGNAENPSTPTTPSADVSKQVQNELSNPAIAKNTDFTKLNNAQRTEMGLTDTDRAILHLWGRQMNERGKQNGDVYLNGGFTPKETELIKVWKEQEMKEFGHINGSKLDEAFFDLNDRMEGLAPGTTASQYAGRQLHQSSGQKINLENSLTTNAQNGGLSAYEQGVLRLWGHQPLYSNGVVDGSILGYTIGNEKALDSNTNSVGNGVDNVARSLLEADFMTDGTRNGDTLRGSFDDVMDKLYGIDANRNGRLGITENQVRTDAMGRLQQRAAAAGSTVQQAMSDVGAGVKDAITNAGSFVKEHPVISAVGAGGVAAATAVCPFLGGLAVGAAGLGAAHKMINGQATA